MKKTDYANINPKKVRVGILISDKGEFRALKIARDKEIFYNYKMADHQKYLAILNVYALAKELNLCEEKFLELFYKQNYSHSWRHQLSSLNN